MKKNTLISTASYSYLYSNSKKSIILLHPEITNICETYIRRENIEVKHNLNSYFYNKFLFLKENGFFENGETFSKLTKEQAELKMPKIIAFETTEKCNLNCTYCSFRDFYNKTDYVRASKENGIETALNYINFIYNKFGELPNSFAFYGGEPLLNFKLISETVEYLKKKVPEQNFRFDMTTNGLLIDKYVEFLASNNFFILISLDGNEYQNRFRVFHDGSNSTQTVINNIHFLQKKYPDFYSNRVSFATTLPANGSIDEIDNFFLKTFQKLPQYSEMKETDIKKEKKEEFYSLFGKKNKDRKNIYFFLNLNHSNYFSFLKEDRKEQDRIFPNGTCFPFELRHLITAQGAILPCEKVDYKYSLGTVKSGNININPEEIAKSYNNYIQKTMKLCSTCYVNNCSFCMFLMEWKNDTPTCPNYLNKNDIKNAISNMEVGCKDSSTKEVLWFYIESYVYIFQGKGIILLYNSINGKFITIKASSIVALIKEIDNNNNSNIVSITNEFYNSQENFIFFRKIQNEFMGDVVRSEINSVMPFVPKNNVKISDTIIQGFQLKKSRESEKAHLLQHITQVDLYLDSIFDHLSDKEKKTILISGKKIELNTKKILSLFEYLLNLKEIFLYSKDLLLFPNIINEIRTIRKKLGIKEEAVYLININYLHIFTNNVLDEELCDSIKAIDSKNSLLKITVRVNIADEKLIKAIGFFNELLIPFIYTFLIEEEKDIEIFDELISEYNIENYEIKPVYLGTNLTLFEQNVFVNEEDIMSSFITAKEINIRKEINPNFFGKIAVLPDGKVSCDLQKPIYAEISDNSLYKLIYSEITKGDGLWKLTRDKVEPCKTCVYKLLCPPISEYELNLERYNLCNYK